MFLKPTIHTPLFCPPNLLCLSTPISINTFPTKFSQQSQSLALSPTLGLRHHSTDSLPTPQSLFFNLCWILLSLHFSFLTLFTAPMSTFTSKMEISTMFWKLQLRLLFHIRISTRMCTDTSSSIFLALIFTLRFLLSYLDATSSTSYWSQNSKHDPWVFLLSSLISKLCLFYSIKNDCTFPLSSKFP